MSMTRTALAVATALGLLAGCGGDGDDSTTGKAQSFEEALGIDEASMQEREQEVQEAVRTCMKDQGFEYIPVDPSQMGLEMRQGSADGDDLDQLRKNGYGITEAMGAERRPAGSRDDDPNQAIRERLSEADREAYEVALFGESIERGEDGEPGVMIRMGDDEEEGPGANGGGCFQKAQREVPGGPGELRDEFEELEERVMNDPRIVEVLRKWAACMAESGYTQWEQPQDIPEYLFGKMQELTGSTDGTVRFNPDEENAAMLRLRDEELRIARADADCREETGGMKVYERVRKEMEERFLEEYRADNGS